MARRRRELAQVVAPRPASRLGRRWARPTARSRSASSGRRGAAALRPHDDQRRARTGTSIVRQPIGVAGLIIAANTPIANVAWKVFPALVCGNAAVLKAAEDTPAHRLAVRGDRARGGAARRRVQRRSGTGPEAGEPLVAHPDVARHQLHRLDGGGPARSRSPPARGWPGYRSSSAARTRSWSATTPTWTRPSSGRSSRRSATPGSAAPPAAASSCSTRSTRGFATRWWSAPGRSGSARPTTTTSGR